MTAELLKFQPRVDQPDRHMLWCNNCSSSLFKLIADSAKGDLRPECVNCGNLFEDLIIEQPD